MTTEQKFTERAQSFRYYNPRIDQYEIFTGWLAATAKSSNRPRTTQIDVIKLVGGGSVIITIGRSKIYHSMHRPCLSRTSGEPLGIPADREYLVDDAVSCWQCRPSLHDSVVRIEENRIRFSKVMSKGAMLRVLTRSDGILSNVAKNIISQLEERGLL